MDIPKFEVPDLQVWLTKEVGLSSAEAGFLVDELTYHHQQAFKLALEVAFLKGYAEAVKAGKP